MRTHLRENSFFLRAEIFVGDMNIWWWSPQIHYTEITHDWPPLVLWICALAKTDRLVKLTDPWSMSSVNNTNQKRPHPLDIVCHHPLFVNIWCCQRTSTTIDCHSHYWLRLRSQLDWRDVCAVIRSMMRAATKLVKANKVLDAALFGDFSSDIGDNIGSNFVLKTNFLWPN